MDKDMIGEVCGMHGRDKNIHTEFWWYNCKQKSRRSIIVSRNPVGVQSFMGIILMWILQERWRLMTSLDSRWPRYTQIVRYGENIVPHSKRVENFLAHWRKIGVLTRWSPLTCLASWRAASFWTSWRSIICFGGWRSISFWTRRRSIICLASWRAFTCRAEGLVASWLVEGLLVSWLGKGLSVSCLAECLLCVWLSAWILIS